MEVVVEAKRTGLSDQVRSVASRKYVEPALRSGHTEVSIRVKDLSRDLRADGFPENHTPQICSALQGQKFQRENGLRIKNVEGPPSKMGTTVVITYTVENRNPGGALAHPATPDVKAPTETPKERIRRLTESLSGLMKDEYAKYGGGEAYLRWVRYEDAE